MRGAIVSAALVAGALAVPFNNAAEKRDVVYDTKVDVVYVTDITTVTVDGPAPSAANANHNFFGGHYPHGHNHGGWGSAPAQTTVEATPTPSANSNPPPSNSGSASGGSGSSGSSGSSGATPTSYSEIVVLAHNLHRKNHSAPDIVWDDGLASSAAGIAASCVYAHNVDYAGGGYGQNIAAGVQSDNVSAIITDLFYNGEVNWYNGLYGQAQPSMTNFEHWGHFSQIVWKATTSVGCATQDCSGQGLANVGSDVSPYFTVCNYKSPGNFAGEYGANVGEPLGEPTAQWNTGL